MTGTEFIKALSEAIAPQTITGKTGDSDGVRFTFSDGRVIQVERKAVTALKSADDVSGYIARVLV